MNAAKRYKDIKMPFTCPLTKREFNSSTGLAVYLTKTLNHNHQEYYDSYINHRDNSCFFCGNKGKFISVGKGYRNLCENQECIKKSFNSHSVEGIMYRKFISREEAIIEFDKENLRQLKEREKTMDKKREINPNFDKERVASCKEFWIKRNFNEEEADNKSKEYRKNNNILSLKRKKENKEKDFTYYYKTTPMRIEYFIKKGFSEEEANQMLVERQNTFSKEKCIEKHGEELGLKIWQDRQIKWLNTLDLKTDEEKTEINRKKLFNKSGYSKISQKLFWEIQSFFIDNDIHFEELNGEIIRYDKSSKKHYRYDYIDFTSKKCIEFNGDFWHSNPKIYNPQHIHKITKIKAIDQWNNDLIKENWLVNRGYKVLVIWESEYRKHPTETLNRCLDFLRK
jgi:hypothetical protein